MVKKHQGEATAFIGAKVPRALVEAAESAVAAGVYLNTSDLLRDALRYKLEQAGFLPAASDGGGV